MTVIRPNSISGINSITAEGGDINLFRADGLKGDAFINNITGVAATFTNISAGSSVTAVTIHGSGANLTTLNADNLSSGSVPSARITQGSVTQYVTPFDDDKLVNDISTLALKISALENSTASNTNSTFVDTYQDSAGISTITNAVRNTVSEYVSSISETLVSYDFNTAGTHGEPQLFGLTTQTSNRRSAYWTNDQVRGFDSGSPSQYGMTIVDFAFDLSGDFTHYTWWKTATNGATSNGTYPTFGVIISPLTDITSGKAPTLSGSSIFNINSTTQAALQTLNSGRGPYVITQSNTILQNTFSTAAYSHLNIASMINGGVTGGATQHTRNYSTVSNSHGYMFSQNMDSGAGLRGMKMVYTKSNNTLLAGYLENQNGTQATDGRYTITNLPTSGRMFLFSGHSEGTTDTNAYFSLRNDQGIHSSGSFLQAVVNATGSYESTTINAAATTSKMGVVITYTDAAGTATLNTDLKVSLSADNGSNFTQVTLVAQPNFSTGIKMAKANDVTISNTGTQLKYKVEFANQSASKETRVNGVSLQY